MKRLIIEGPDLSGKSTAIEKIAKHFKNGFLIKNLYKPKQFHDTEIYKQYWRIIHFINSIEEVKNNFFILDRFYPSQAVYSILRNDDEMDSGDIKDLDGYCANMNFIYVYITAPLDVLRGRFQARGDEHIKIEQLELLKMRYDEFYEKTLLPKIIINTMKKDWIKELEAFIK
jgi:thymidylate kinase